MDEQEYVVVCAPMDGYQPVHDSVVAICTDCGYRVWVTKTMKANVLDAHPNARARCMTCARKRVLAGDTNGRIEVPHWQREELADLGDVDQAAALATRWLTGA